MYRYIYTNTVYDRPHAWYTIHIYLSGPLITENKQTNQQKQLLVVPSSSTCPLSTPPPPLTGLKGTVSHV